MQVDGHKLYRYKAFNYIPLIRKMVVRVGYAKLEMGVRAEDLKVYCQMIEDEVNEGNLARISQLNGFLQLQLENFASDRIALEIGGYAVLVDDEPHDSITDEYNDIKSKLLEAHPAVRAFFLSESVGLISDLNNSIAPSLMMESLNHPQRRMEEKTFLHLISQPEFRGLWTPITPPPLAWQKRIAALLSRKS